MVDGRDLLAGLQAAVLSCFRGAALGAYVSRLVLSLGPSGRSWDPLGPSGGGLGPLLGPMWMVLGRSRGLYMRS